ncbi:uncharacterized protein LOC142109144 [Mixophyes fleayi]|uniref:uncharacterized protein LOC142109144 n=1 Tax=Mixophyes fleayi TaxID=3061075 RepID=UPI003F4E2C6A
MVKVKAGNILGVGHILGPDLNQLPQHSHIHLDPSQEHQMPRILQDPPGRIQEQHLGNSLLHQMPHILLDPPDLTQEHLLDSNHLHQMPHILLDPPDLTQEHLLDSNHLHQMPHILLDPLDRTQEHLLDSNNLPHILLDPLDLIQAYQLGSSRLHQMPHTLQAPTQELLLGRTQQHQIPSILQDLLVLIQEVLLDHSQELQLGPILQHPGGSILLGPILQVLPECQDHILTLLDLLVNNTQILQDKVLHLVVLILVSRVLQDLHRVGLGALVHGAPRVGNTPLPQICHTQPLARSQILVLRRPYHGVMYPLASGDHQLHFLEVLDHTQIQDPILEAARFQRSLPDPATYLISL